MARIFFSMSGEGRGHATRVRAMVDMLRQDHEIEIFAPGDAYELLAPAYRGTDIPVRRIPCLRFVYNDSGRLDKVQTFLGSFRYLWRMPALLRRLEKVLRRRKPDVVITDFEPALPRAAKRARVPFISFNHQHFLIVNDLRELPLRLRLHVAFMGLVVRMFYWGQARTIVSSFYFPPLKARYRDVVQVGVILRPSVIGAPRGREGHLVAYLRKFARRNVLEALRSSGMPVYIYGLGERPPQDNLTFKAISEEDFLRDLGTCEALVSTAGNQLVGEALYLGKPVLAMPEPNNHEQYINAYFLEKEGTGEWVELEELDAPRMASFLSKLDIYRSRIRPEKFNGNPLALDAIRTFVSRTFAPAGATPAKESP